jgi:ADP-heptose:LPS heptosyltransferase
MKLLVIRNSALGDVAMVRPCLVAMQHLFPEVEIVLLTRAKFHGIFDDLSNVKLIQADYENKHKGAAGLLKLAKEIYKNESVDQVIDLHDVLRSKLIRTYFKTKGVPVCIIDKNRKAKKELIKGISKAPLMHTVRLYANVFKQAGFDLESSLSNSTKKKLAELASGIPFPASPVLKIGIAPFAKHALKTWPHQYMMELMKLIQQEHISHFYLFGGGEEVEALKSMSSGLTNYTIVAGKYSLSEELNLIGKLDFMISMDSANMHLSAMMGTKVFSIWGATDPLAGFGAWLQPEERSIRIAAAELGCRPCTVFGKGECARKDFACMHWLTPAKVLNELKEKGAFG